MQRRSTWVTDANAALLTDLYQLTMLQVYWKAGLQDEAVFSLFARRLPAPRNFLLACGLDDALHFLEHFHFSALDLDELRLLGLFSDDFLVWLGKLHFTGDVYAVPEGTPVFGEEPILEIVAPLPEAQIAETFLLNQVHFQTVLASKAVRVVLAAGGRSVVDFGLRRMHGTDAGMKAVRAFYIAGVDATSNVLGGRRYGMPVSGTMAHSFVQAHDDELEAFRSFARQYPDGVLLVDTYDTLQGTARVIALARELGPAFAIRAVRLDSGDLAGLAFDVRRMLDAAGLERVEIFASAGLDEYEIASLVRRGAPITGFGVGTNMGVAADAPALDAAYKLTMYAGKGRLKLSPGKRLLPGRKQIFRREHNEEAVEDVIGCPDEALPGRPLLAMVMRRGRRLPAGRVTLGAARERARQELLRLPARIRALAPTDRPYPVRVSQALRAREREALQRLGLEENGTTLTSDPTPTHIS
jgi:nicotinate phosphoribosyltransferase